MTGRPVPVPDTLSAPFWEQAAKHVLTLPRCSVCDQFSFPPDVSCPKCHTTEPDFKFEPISGRGTLKTWTVVRYSFLKGFEVPYFLADIELEGASNVRMIGRLLESADTKLSIGAPVKVAFEDIAPGVAVPSFKLEESA